eukprot:3520772-Amphidinium_carterae.1
MVLQSTSHALQGTVLASAAQAQKQKKSYADPPDAADKNDDEVLPSNEDSTHQNESLNHKFAFALHNGILCCLW